MNKEAVLDMMNSLLKESVSYGTTLVKRGPIEIKSNGRGLVAAFKNRKMLFDGDFDNGADAFFMNVPGKKAQMSFEYSDDIADYVEKNF